MNVQANEKGQSRQAFTITGDGKLILIDQNDGEGTDQRK
jgi:hypothetical protein